MTRAEKATIVEELYQKFSETNNFYFTDPQGLNVESINNFRRLCFKQGVEYKVYKNTLIRKALEKQDGVDVEKIDELGVLKGYSGIIFSAETANLPAKVIKEYKKKGLVEDMPKLKAALIENELYVGDESISTLSELKSKEELIGEIISLLQSPAKNVISALQSGGDQLAGIVKTLSEKEEK